MAKELDIISIWEKGKKLSPKVDIDVDQVIRSKSKGTLYWIRIILSIEFWINIASIPVFTYLFFINAKDYFWGGSLLFITIAYIFYYRFLISEVRQFSYTEDVRTGLKKLYRYLNFFLLHYKVVIWISMTIGLIKGLMDGVNNGSITEEMKGNLNFWLISIGVSIVMLSIIGLILTYLIHLIYGRKIKRLKKLVRELT